MEKPKQWLGWALRVLGRKLTIWGLRLYPKHREFKAITLSNANYRINYDWPAPQRIRNRDDE